MRLAAALLLLIFALLSASVSGVGVARSEMLILPEAQSSSS